MSLSLNFKYNLEFSILICTSCKQAINIAALNRYITTRHPDYNKEEVDTLVNITNNLTIKEDKNIPLSKFFDYYFKDLDKGEIGYIYTRCNKHASTSYKILKQHLNNAHAIKEKRYLTNIESYYLEKYPIQTLFKGSYLRYFAIKKDKTSTFTSASISNPIIEDILSSYSTIEKNIEARTKAITQENLEDKEINSFLEKIYFYEYIYTATLYGKYTSRL